MQRSASLVLLALVGEVALGHIERLGHAFVEMCRNDRAGAHTDVQHDRPQRVIRVADLQRDVALTGERETIGLELIVEYFLIDHDTVSCASKSPPADLISEAARLFLELTKRQRHRSPWHFSGKLARSRSYSSASPIRSAQVWSRAWRGRAAISQVGYCTRKGSQANGWQCLRRSRRACPVPRSSPIPGGPHTITLCDRPSR